MLKYFLGKFIIKVRHFNVFYDLFMKRHITKPKREQKGAHPVYDPTPIGNYRIYEISQLTKQQADIRLDMEDPEKVTRMMEEDRLRDLGLL